MNITVSKEGQNTQCLILPMWKDLKLESFVKELDADLGGALSSVLKLKDFDGKPGQSAFVYTSNKKTPRILLVGLGEKKNMTVRRWKQVVGAAVLGSQKKKWTQLSVFLPAQMVKLFGAKKLASETAVAAHIAGYSYDEHKEKKTQVKHLKSVEFVADADARTVRSLAQGASEGEAIADAVNFTRSLGNTPPSVMTPTLLAKHAQDLAKEFPKVKVKVLKRPDMKKLGMGCLLGVSQGSELEPTFSIVEYKNGPKSQKPTVLVGKGITFDSGGLSLKPSAYMTDMKFDMLGAATVLGTIKAAAALGLKKNIVGLVPSCENMPSGSSYRPDDILINMDGKSVLIDNTDAEGRLILCDALSYARKLKPKEVIDFATLTGACLVAIGNERSGLFSPEEKMIEKLEKSSVEAGEQLWHLPLGEEFSESLKCEIADIKNTGQVGGRGYGGASTAAAFLQFFTDYPWAHIDLGSSYYGGKGKPYIRGGANGFGVQTMVEYLR